MNRMQWRNHIPDLHNGAYRRTWDKAMARESMRAAVTAKCQDCCNWDKAEIKNCLVPNCPLYLYRPYQGKTAAETVAEMESGAVA